MSGGPYLFDVSLIALAHAGTPVSEPALRYVRQAVEGEIDVVVPHPALIGAQHILRRVYRFSNTEAARLMTQFRDARRIHWYEAIPEPLLRDGLTLAGTANINGWDGYYAAVARSEGSETILTLDDDFERVDGVACEVVLDTNQFETLNEYIDRL
jgi:predicted nucleic acid-binding protein